MEPHLTSDSGNLNAALDYAARGWSVFPCHYMTDGNCSCGKLGCTSPGKHPRTANGYKDATTDSDRIRSWWENCPDANIGIATGSVTGLWVLDLDGFDGIADFDRLKHENEAVPDTPTVATGGGGRHLYFVWPSDREIRNKSKLGNSKIDVRGNGGYVIAPPSNHRSGLSYSWERTPDDVALTEAPAWLLDFVEGRVSRPADSIDDDFAEMTGGNDLRSHPGVSEGNRHNTALKLIGAHIGRGEDPFTVLRLAQEWGKRCDPPMDRGEVEQIVRGVSRKDSEKRVKPPRKKAPFPILDQAALYGLAGDIVRAIGPQSESDPVAILVQALAFFGNVIGRSAFQTVEDTPHFTNLFAVLVGDSSKARKGTSADRIKALFMGVDPDWTRYRILSGISSGEGLINQVRDPTEKDRGITDKRLLSLETEFANVLGVMKREATTVSAVIRAAWDGSTLQTITKNSPMKATDAHISIVGHITTEELLKKMTEVEGFNGFANRFLWLCVKRASVLPEGGQKVDLTLFQSRLSKAVDFAGKAPELRRDDAARVYWAELYRKIADTDASGMFGAVTSRAEAQVLRLSTLYALLDLSPTIRIDHLKAAYALWCYAENSARYIFGASTGDPETDKVKAFILNEGPISTTELHRRLANHFDAKDLNRILQELKSTGVIKSEEIKTAGRPVTRWSAG